MVERSWNKRVFQILLFMLITGCLFVFGACDFASPNKTNPKNEPYVVDVLDICVDIVSPQKEVYLNMYLTIEDERIDLKRVGFEIDKDEDVRTVYEYLEDELDGCDAETFTFSAYTESADGTKKSEEKSVTFTNKSLNPKLDVETGLVTWRTCEFIKHYNAFATCPPYSRIEFSENNTTGQINTNNIFNSSGEDLIVMYIEPIKVEEINPEDIKTTYFSTEKKRLRIARQTLEDVHFYDNKISWKCFDATCLGKEVDFSFDITIYDGDDVIEDTVEFTRDYNFTDSYPYTPKTDNFYFTIKGGANDPEMVKTDAITVRPEYVGKVSNLAINDSKISWDFEKFGNRELTADNLKYEVIQDETSLKTISNNYLMVSELNQVYGNTTVKLRPKIWITDCYCTAEEVKPLTMFYAKTPVIQLEENNDDSVFVKFTNVDENAKAYKLICVKSNISETFENVEEGFKYTFTPDKNYIGKHNINVEAIYDEENIIENDGNIVTVEILKHTKFLGAYYTEDGWNLTFDGDVAPHNHVEYFITTPDDTENKDGLIRWYDNIDILLPEMVSSAFSTKEFKINLRYIPKVSSTKIELSLGFDEYVIKNLPCPTTSSINDGIVSWDMDTSLPYDGCTVKIYKKISITEKKLQRTIDCDDSFDLTSITLAPGNYEARIYANAPQDRFATGEIILDGSRSYYLDFNKFSEAMAHPTGKNTVKFMGNDQDRVYHNRIDKLSVKLYTDNNEEVVTIENNEEIDVKAYLDSWAVDSLKADVTVVGRKEGLSSATRTITITSPKVSGFELNNGSGEVSWSDYLTGSTYDCSLKIKADDEEDYHELISATELTECELEVKEAILAYVKLEDNVDKSFGNIKLEIITNIEQKYLTAQKNQTELVLAPAQTDFNFHGLTYGVFKKSLTEFGFDFNQELETTPYVTIRTTEGDDLGKKLATDGAFAISKLTEGDYVLEITNDIRNYVLNEKLTLNLPYYHSFKVQGRILPSGDFHNFKKGYYVYKLNEFDNTYVLDKTQSHAATVDFKPSKGTKFYFNGEEIEFTNGVYTLDLTVGRSITMQMEGEVGLMNEHIYNTYNYGDNFKFTMSFNTELPPIPTYVNVTNGELNISVSEYIENASYTVRKYGLLVGETRKFTKDVVTAKDTYKPINEYTHELIFTPGSELEITISGSKGEHPVEAMVVVKYTVPFQ